MAVREATYADLLPASKILATAFHDEALFGGHFHPHRAKYPDDVYLFFLAKLRIDWAHSASPNLRIVLSHPPSNPALITGVGIWLRKRATPVSDSWATAATEQAMRAVNTAEAMVCLNRAAEPANHGLLADTEPFIKHFWSGSRAESWYLDLLGVDPKQGGHGYGKLLVRYGLDLAREEGVSASVISALGRESFYTALGFDVTVGTVRSCGGEENPMTGREELGGTVHFWDGGREPTGVKGYGEA